ncbi:MAG TPA: DUF192 domain-containing protein [Candidatus Bathyarchaeia archaeon]|nr:DUF192 domain-containing protein [Candidatus Bathyarchaeia archaeon]
MYYITGDYCKTLQDYSRLYNKSGSREGTLTQGWFLLLGIITIIGLIMLPNIFVLAKVEKDVPFENYVTLAVDPYYINVLTSKAVTLDLGNYTGANAYYAKTLAIDPQHETALDNNTFLHDVNKSFPGDNIYLHAKVVVNGYDVLADIALTGEQQTKGLDVKNNLTENQGMLFVFQQPYRYGFWMIGMKFPIDIIWLDSNGVVTHIEPSLKPCPPASSNLLCQTYFPEKDSQYVLETVAGFSTKHNVRLGTHISFELIK